MKVLKNYAYNLSYQLLVIILPIITTPYVTRIFSSDDLGTYGYFNSIVTYFILLATLGVANYGTKVISGHREEIGENFWGDLFSANRCYSFFSILVRHSLFLASFYEKSRRLYFRFKSGFEGIRHFLALSRVGGFSKDYCSKYYGQTPWRPLHLPVCQIGK